MATYTKTSRYNLSANGQLATRKTGAPITYYQYVSRQGDTFERLAAKLFNDGRRYWEIADINPQVQYPDNIPVGTILRIPQ